MKLHSLLYLAALMALVAPANAEVVQAATHPLDNWQWRNPPPTGDQLNATAYGNGSYVAVGLHGAIFRSSDATEWSQCISGTKENLSDVIFASGVFVAVGENGTILHSVDGLLWSSSNLDSPETVQSLAYGEGLFVAFGGNGTILRSPDGVNWVTSRAESGWGGLSKVTFGNGVFIGFVGAVGIRSTDGVIWNDISLSALCVAFGNGQFVAAGGNGGIVRSSDGLTWTESNSGVSPGFNDIAFGNGVFVAAAGDGYKMFRSIDGISWSPVLEISASDGRAYVVDYANGLFIAPHTSPFGTIHRSTDGLNWVANNAGFDPVTNADLNSVAYGGGRYVAVGRDGVIRYSDGGGKWQVADSGTTTNFFSVAFGNGRFVAVGGDTALHSPDGINWTIASLPCGVPALTFAKGKFIAVGYDGQILTSADGATWDLTAHIPSLLTGITYGNGVYVAVGSETSIYSSTDTVNWTDRGSSVVYFPSPSTNGLELRPRLTTLWAVHYANGLFVAVGEIGRVITSQDGVTWAYRGRHFFVDGGADYTSVITSLSFLEGNFIAASDIIWRSTDGIDWVVASRAGGSLYGVTVGGGSAVAVGTYGAILQSGPGIGALSPGSITAGSPSFTLTVTGSMFESGSLIKWNGASRPTTFVNDTTLTVLIAAADIAPTNDIATASVTVQNPNGATSFSKAFAITAANVTAVQSVIAGAGVTASVSTAPSVTSGTQSGVSATLLNAGDATPVTVSAASYSSNPSPSTAFDVTGNSEVAGNFLDLQVKGADPQDQLAANFYYPFTVTGAEEENLRLKYYNGSAWVNVLSSGGAVPEKNTTDNLEETVSGGRFAAYFDNTSTPRVTELTGTFFAMAIPRPPLAFTGFLAPIGGADTTGGTFAQPLRTFKAGSTIPVKFTIARDGTAVVTGEHRLQATKWTDATTADAAIDATPQGAATTGNQFVLKDSQWQFNLDTKTTGLTKGIWQLVAALSDGSQHHVWIQIK